MHYSYCTEGVGKILPDPFICTGSYSFLCIVFIVDELESVCLQDAVRCCTLQCVHSNSVLFRLL